MFGGRVMWPVWKKWGCLTGALGLLTLGPGMWRWLESCSAPSSSSVRPSPAPILSALRIHPRQIFPAGDWPPLVSPKELAEVLQYLEPNWEYHRAGDLLHALRLWGPQARFPAQAAFVVPAGVRPLSGADMLRFFQEEQEFRRWYPLSPPYFFPGRQGWSARIGERNTIEYNLHVDDFLALAAECRLPLDTLFHWGGQTFTLADLFAASFYWYHPQQELEFTAVAYGHYVRGGASWLNRFGQRYTLEDVAAQVLALAPARRACYGTHVPYALVILWRAGEEAGVLSAAMRQRLWERMQYFSRRLVQTQRAAGWWDASWAGPISGGQDLEELVTCPGHHLEWLALAPAEVCPPLEVVRRAAQQLFAFLREPDVRVLSAAKQYAPTSHAARALVLWSGRFYAAELLEPLWRARSRKGSRG
jgi:hypothetical protein